ncbi:MAG TPA: carboxypeptidase-like regulatory domain-containing protein, partial [Bryobacteraceae bacterium]|nr:carboxypeptidase-like regulatory domain-containing protein [Bryobacteraceae bacterium]
MQVTAKDTAGKPVPGAQILLRRGSDIATVGETDADGLVHLPPLAAGKYDLEASKPGYLTLQQKSIEIPGAGA